MSPSQELLLALAVLYLFECLLRVPRGALLLWSWPGRTMRRTVTEDLPGTETAALFLAPPLPPLGRVFELSLPAVSISPEGISSLPPVGMGPKGKMCGSAWFLGFRPDLGVAADGRDVRLDRETCVRCGSAVQAGDLAELVRRLCGVSNDRREAVLADAIAEAFDVQRLRERLSMLSSEGLTTRVAANMLFAFLFVVTPAILLRWGVSSTWAGLLLVLALLWSCTVVTALRAHARLFPAHKAERRQKAVLMVLTPLAAVRAHDHLSRHALDAFHPLCVAAGLLDRPRFVDLARRVSRNYMYAPPTERDRVDCPGAVAAQSYCRAQLREGCERLMRDLGLPPEDLLAPPAPLGPDSRSYCPRCLSDFARWEGECNDCGLPLMLFEPEQSGNRATSGREVPQTARPLRCPAGAQPTTMGDSDFASRG